ncbi:MAG: hypothetical protein JRF53_00480 [Deltaproteobacteria bacterium]|nr:hypothetical protein [Deltaproteobacteria bacterium]
MKKVILIILAFLVGGCATTQLGQTEQTLESSVETLAMDWPQASGAIRGGLDEGYLPQNIIDKLNKIDSWWKDEKGNWIPAEKIVLTEYQKWFIAGARLAHMGPILQAIIQQYAPGLLKLPQVISGLTFLGLGAL